MELSSNYQLDEEIYKGTKSVIYRAHRQTNEQSVIIKALQSAYPRPEDSTRIHHEYKVLTHLEGKGIPQVYALEGRTDHPMLVMEDDHSTALTSLLYQPLELEIFLQIAIQLVDILNHIHRQKVIHKDINPRNILINQEKLEVSIIDFGISSILPRENQALSLPENIEGTLAYISPEQTGRMNRTLDYRTDYYSLGVTFYELLVGEIPFQSLDSMELIHCHMAKPPPLPHYKNPDIPETLSQIILKLMAKSADERYQSGEGLLYDLKKCWSDLETVGTISNFKLGGQDISYHFQIKEKLYGREREVQMLLKTFEKVSSQSFEPLIITGFSGSGKSALVYEIHQLMTEKRGHFIAGKYEQYKKNIPYLAICQALSEFCHYLLGQDTKSLENWRQDILEAVGINGQVLIELIPDLELVIGPQPAIIEIGPQESQNRLNLVFEKFIVAICQKDHPLVMFIDDLQWADSASLALLKRLILHDDIQYLLLICAYRDNEVDSKHPLGFVLKEIEKEHSTLNKIHLENLSKEDINRLVSDTLNTGLTDTESLTDLIYSKTQGNIFFSIEFLKSLYSEGLLAFKYSSENSRSDIEERRSDGWQWDVQQIKTKNITDNAVELIAEKIGKLEPFTQSSIQLAACIGNQFDLNTLSIINDFERRKKGKNNIGVFDILQILWPAIEEGLILSLDNHYKFLTKGKENQSDLLCKFKFTHDKIQQAAYSLVSQEQREQIHLKIGRLLLTNTPPKKLEENLFDVTNQWNQAFNLITSKKDKIQAATLNLQAGKKAKQALALESALNYFKLGLDLMPKKSWQSHHSLNFQLLKEYIQTLYLTAHYEESDALFQTLRKHARNIEEKLVVFILKLEQFSIQWKLKDVLETGKTALELLDLKIPKTAEAIQKQINRDMKKINQLRQQLGKTIEDLPDMHDDKRLIILKIFSQMSISAYHTGEFDTALWLSVKRICLVLSHGSSEEAGQGLATLGLYNYLPQQDYKAAHHFGQIGLEMYNKKYQNSFYRSRSSTLFGGLLQHWQKNMTESIDSLRESVQLSQENGDFLYTCISLQHLLDILLNCGSKLEEIRDEIDSHLPFLKRNCVVFYSTKLLPNICQTIIILAGEKEHSNLRYHDFNEQDFLKDFDQQTNLLTNYYSTQIRNWYWSGCYQKCLTYLDKVESIEQAQLGRVIIPETYFFMALALTACFSSRNESEQKKDEIVLEVYQGKLQNWSENSPDNYRHKYLLLAAERAKLANRFQDALQLYKEAIASAREVGFINFEALGNELFAKFWLEQEEDDYASIHMSRAYSLYSQWGATVKRQEIEKNYPNLYLEYSGESLRQKTGTTKTRSLMNVDLHTIMKASQALSGEIDLENLLSKMMHILIENAGAEKGFLILQEEKEGHSGEWIIQAEGHVGEKEFVVMNAYPVKNSEKLSERIVNYVIRTYKTIVLNDAAHEGQFTMGPYIVKNQPKSILCSPIINQGRLVGIIYLENNLQTGAFTKDRLQVLNLLSTQAAISIDNALLYQKEIAAKQKLQHLNAIGTQLAQIFERNQVLNLIFTALQKEAGILRSSLYLYQNKRGTPKLFLFATLPELHNGSLKRKVSKKVIHFGEGAIGTAAQEQKIIYLPNTQQNQTFPIDQEKKNQKPFFQDSLLAESLLCIPLLDGNLLLGVISLSAPVSHLEESFQERMVAETLCGFLSISLKNIQLMEETRLAARMEAELQTAAAVQYSLFPKSLPKLPNLELASYYQPASETGGDWYEVNIERENMLYIMIGDVTGHGIPAALVTASICASCHTLIHLWNDFEKTPAPTDILNYLNQTVIEIGAPDYLMTFFVARLDLLSGELTFANAGHNFPILIRDQKEKRFLSSGYRLGNKAEMKFSEKTIQLKENDLLFFFTDGLTESENSAGAMWGERTLVRFLKKNGHLSAQEMVDQVVEKMHTFCENQFHQDDVTIVCCRITQPFKDPLLL